VDDADSQAGGREIWGLPKEQARFDLIKEEPGHIVVRQDNRILCALRADPPRGLLPLRFPWPVFSRQGSRLLHFAGDFSARTGLVRAAWDVPTESPFAALGLDRPRWTLFYKALRLVAHAPRVLRQ
jgi:acetoacetate decarboxylase